MARGYYGAKAAGAWTAHGFTDAWASAAPLAPPMWSLCALSCAADAYERHALKLDSSKVLKEEV